MTSAGGGAADKFSPSGIPLKAAYGPSDTPIDYAGDLNDPGRWPYTRGVQESTPVAVEDDIGLRAALVRPALPL